MSISVGDGISNDDDSGTGVSAGCSGNANQNKNRYYNDDYYKSKNSKGHTDDQDSGKMRCGNKSSSCDQWWGGMQNCYGANVAYSLYGILPGDNPFQSPCNRHTFINSFFTRDGLDSFLQASNGNVDSSSLPEYCTNGDEGGYGTTATCSSDGTFTLSTFNGACLAQNFVATTDSLNNLNEELKEMHCVLIYDGSKTDYATELLSQSVQCSFDKNHCPDPYGLIRKYEYNLFMASTVEGEYVAPDVDTHTQAKELAAGIFSFLGIVLLAVRIRSLRYGRSVEDVDLRRNLHTVYA